MITLDEAQKKIDEQIQKLLGLRTKFNNKTEVLQTMEDFEEIIEHAQTAFKLWERQRNLPDKILYSKMNGLIMLYGSYEEVRAANDEFSSHIKETIKIFKKIKMDLPMLIGSVTEPMESTDNLSKIENIFNRFIHVAKKLEDRHNQRNTLKIEDEYDVQDLFHSILKLYFDNIEDECTSIKRDSTANRIDFFLPDESIAIEIKFGTRWKDKARTTRKSMKTIRHDIKQEIINDKEAYSNQSLYQKILFFVYDPDNQINEKVKFESGLNNVVNGIEFKVYVRPTF